MKNIFLKIQTKMTSKVFVKTYPSVPNKHGGWNQRVFLEMNKHSGPNKGMLVRFFLQKNKIQNTRVSY